MLIYKKPICYNENDLKLVSLTAITKDLAKLSAFIAGGAVLYVYTGGEYRLNDIDVFCFSHPILAAETQEESIHNALVKYGYTLSSTSPTGLVKTYKHEFETFRSVQVITKQYASITDLFSNFDFDISQMLFDGEYVHCTEDASHNVASKTITVNNLSRPLNSAVRLCKLYSLGFSIEGAMARLLLSVNQGSDISEQALTEYCELIEARDKE